MARRRGDTSRLVRVPVPAKGLNQHDPLSAMKPNYAWAMENVVASGANMVRPREGFVTHATGAGAAVESLMTYHPASGGAKLFAASVSTIYDVTSAGAAVSSLTGLTNARWSSVNFATPAAGPFLVIANGADAPRNYNGAWSTPAITGVATTLLTGVMAHASRLWFIEAGSLRTWYLPVSSIAGAAQSLDLGSSFRRGGKLVAQGSWGRDTGSGMQHLACFITDRGQVAIYQGSDPSSASTWARVGVFDIAEPIGERCLIQTGSDLGILTTQGLLPLREVLPMAQSATFGVAATYAVDGGYIAAVQSYGENFGWQAVELPSRQSIFINVPTSPATKQFQYVMNTQTNAWTIFTGLNGAGCFALHDGELYFGGASGQVYRYGGVSTDAGAPIGYSMATAYNDFGSGRLKHVKQVRPYISTENDVLPAIGIAVDYSGDAYTTSESFSVAGSSAEWDVATWDDADWAGTLVTSIWRPVPALGSALSIVVKGTCKASFTLSGFDLLLEDGGIF